MRGAGMCVGLACAWEVCAWGGHVRGGYVRGAGMCDHKGAPFQSVLMLMADLVRTLRRGFVFEAKYGRGFVVGVTRFTGCGRGPMP